MPVLSCLKHACHLRLMLLHLLQLVYELLCGHPDRLVLGRPLDGCNCSIVPVFRLVGHASFDQCQCPFVVCCTEAWGWFFDVLLLSGFRSCMGRAVRSLGGVCVSRVGDSCLFLFFFLVGWQCLENSVFFLLRPRNVRLFYGLPLRSLLLFGVQGQLLVV